MPTITGSVEDVAGRPATGTLRVRALAVRRNAGSDAVVDERTYDIPVVSGVITGSPVVDPGPVQISLSTGGRFRSWEAMVPEASSVDLWDLIESVVTPPPSATYFKMPTGGTDGQVLAKSGGALAWTDPPTANAGEGGTLGASDFVNSWWCVPRSIHHTLRNVVYQGGVNREGTMQITTFDLRRRTARKVDLGTFEKDDHNVPAFLVPDDKPPMVAIVRHAVENFVRIRIGAAPHDIDSLGDATEIQVPFAGTCTYAHLIRRPGTNTVALLTRNEDGWYLSISTDWGATWGSAVRFHGLAYGTFRLHGNTVHYAVTTHPTTTPNNAIRYFRINTDTGAITSASGTSMGNLWSFSSVISSTSMTYARQSYDTDAGHNTNRLFDILPDGSILAMQFHKSTPELGGTYGVYRYAPTGATPNSSQNPNDAQRGWVFEPIVASGVPVGYYQSSYVGGMTAGANKDEVWLAREASGTWTLERWTKTDGVWSLADTVATRTDGEKLGRPQVPWGAEGTGLFTGIEYFLYPSDTFMNYYGDQLVLETGIESYAPPSDTSAPSVPGNRTSVPGPGAATLSWSASTDDIGVVGYEIYQSMAYLTTVTGTSHTVEGLNAQPYTFRIKAVDAAGNKSDFGVFPEVTPSASGSGDAILPSAGALVLIDPTSSIEQWPAGVPTTTVANLAADQALAAVGSGVESDYDFTVTNTLTATDGLVERTSKGGLHFIISQATGAANRKFSLSNEAIRAYMAANPGHGYFVSLWASVTRRDASATVPGPLQRFVGFIGTASNDTESVRLATGNKLTVAPSANRSGVKESATPIVLDSPINVSGAHSQIPALGTNADYVFAGHFNADLVNVGASWILYRVYLEDLTISGRTYAQVSGTDNTLFNAAFGSGGRYNGDTYSPVSTLP